MLQRGNTRCMAGAGAEDTTGDPIVEPPLSVAVPSSCLRLRNSAIAGLRSAWDSYEAES